MRKQVTPILFFFLTLFTISCKKVSEVPTQNQNISKETVAPYFNAVKENYKTIKSKVMVDSLLNNVNWNDQTVLQPLPNIKLVLVDLNDSYKTMNLTSKHRDIKLVLQFKNNQMEYAYVADIIGDYNDSNFGSLLLENINGTKTISNKNSIIISMLSVNGTLIFESDYNNGKLQSLKRMGEGDNSSSQSGGNVRGQSNIFRSNSTCKGWYLITTYYVDGIVVDQTRQLLYTTGDCGGIGGGGDVMSPCGGIIRTIDEQKEIRSNCGGGGSGGGTGETTQDLVELDLYFIYDDNPRVNLEKMFRCFNNLPNQGASYSITLSVELPDPNDPNKLNQGRRPGHVFLTFTKSNGNNSISQTFGFYPRFGFASLSTFATESAIKNDGAVGTERNIDASITMGNMTELDFNSAKNLALLHAGSLSYDLDDFNCTSYALDVFNFNRQQIEKIIIPSTSYYGITNGLSPNGLYKYLQNNKPFDGNISIGRHKAKTSHGECN